MSKQEKHRCEGSTWNGVKMVQCCLPAEIYRNGCWVCEDHDLVTVQEKERVRREHEYRVFDCQKACEGFDDPMELRRQRDTAVALLQCVQSHDPGPYFDLAPFDTTPIDAFLDTILKGTDNET